MVEDSKDGGVGRAIEWLTSRHAKAVKTAVQNMLNDDLDNEEQAALQKLDDEDWQGMQINAMEWLLAESSIAVKGVQRNVAELLLGPGGPPFAPGQRFWIEQLHRQPLLALRHHRSPARRRHASVQRAGDRGGAADGA